jgi:gamma-polyglutamate biosynthesis protein CapA
MMFDRYIRQVSDKKGDDFVFSCIDPLLQDADMVVGNLEGPITENISRSLKSVVGSPDNYTFTFPTTTTSTLSKHNIKVVNIGNNHISNFGRTGLLSTQNFLDMTDVGYFGGFVGNTSVYRVTKNGINLSFVSFNQFGGESAEKIASTTAKEKAEGRTVIIYTHWGEEYSYEISNIKRIATLFAENGADVIIGSHPHIVLPNEYIGKTLVYYSLGNFIFDQYFNKDVTKGLAIQLDISKDKIGIKEYSLNLKTDGRTCQANQ